MKTMKDNSRKNRIGSFKVDQEFESILMSMNENLSELEKKLIAKIPKQNNSLIILCFSPRSGSTLLSQILARSGAVNYISNYMARFWEAPYLAGLLESKMGIRKLPRDSSFQSNYGRTDEINDPHEFGFFWNKHLKFTDDSHRISAFETKEYEAMATEINAIMSLSDKPLMIKNSIIGLNLDLMNNLFDHIIVLRLERDPIDTALSIYDARMKLFNDENMFFSTRPSNYQNILSESSIPHQIMKQIKGVYDDIDGQINSQELNVINIKYEKIVRDDEYLNHCLNGKIPGNNDFRFQSGESIKLDKKNHHMYAQFKKAYEDVYHD
jgi:hypothetical protein